MVYPLAYLALPGAFFALAGFASGCFFGRPILTFLIMSKVSAWYMACLEMGFIPARCIRIATVFEGNFKSLLISSIVMPSIGFIIGEYKINVNK
jgi:hypothetical protein